MARTILVLLASAAFCLLASGAEQNTPQGCASAVLKAVRKNNWLVCTQLFAPEVFTSWVTSTTESMSRMEDLHPTWKTKEFPNLKTVGDVKKLKPHELYGFYSVIPPDPIPCWIHPAFFQPDVDTEAYFRKDSYHYIGHVMEGADAAHVVFRRISAMPAHRVTDVFLMQVCRRNGAWVVIKPLHSRPWGLGDLLRDAGAWASLSDTRKGTPTTQTTKEEPKEEPVDIVLRYLAGRRDLHWGACIQTLHSETIAQLGKATDQEILPPPDIAEVGIFEEDEKPQALSPRKQQILARVRNARFFDCLDKSVWTPDDLKIIGTVRENADTVHLLYRPTKVGSEVPTVTSVSLGRDLGGWRILPRFRFASGSDASAPPPFQAEHQRDRPE
jgi:hypothetical protein